ncbi:MAG: class I SAM-dependent methyltransferase [Verrucomicrobiales bacterium]|nr:class I SAM-dependent methyltransferase [Verrucomicrobiales bacterium]
MKKHLYNSRLAKVKWFIQRFGAKEIFLKPVRVVFAPVVIPLLSKRTFHFDGQELSYFYHPYNMTWACERCVEVPIGRHYLSQFAARNVLEVGNVLSHYGVVAHDILDKFERAPDVINEDIITFTPPKKYDLVLSISTFEHIGFDDEASEPSGQKILTAIAACRNLLSPNGKLVVTVPMGYNPDLDRLIRSGQLGSARETYLKRVERLEWNTVGKSEALSCRYKEPFPYANAILVAEFGSLGARPSWPQQA